MATITASAGGGAWSDLMTWDGAVAPTSADDVVLNAGSGNVSVAADGSAVCRSLDCNGYTGTLSFDASGFIAIGDGTAGTGNIAVRLSSGMTLSFATFGQFNFVSTSATQQTITTAGKSTPALVFNGAGGSWLLSDACTIAGTSGMTLTNGSLAANNINVSIPGSFNSSNSNTRSLTLGTGTWTLSSVTASWNIATSTNLTLTSTGSTIVFTDTSANAKTFAGGGKTYNIVQISAGGAGAVTFSGNNTFAKLNRTGTGTKTIKFTAGSTTTLSPAAADAFFSGTVGNLYTLESTSAGTAWNLSMASGTLSCDYISLKDSAAAGGATFNASNSTNVSGNSGWNFLSAGKPTHDHQYRQRRVA